MNKDGGDLRKEYSDKASKDMGVAGDHTLGAMTAPVEADKERLVKILKMWAKGHGAPDKWEPKPTLVKWLMKWKAENNGS